MRQYFNCHPTPELETRYATALSEVDACHQIMLQGTNAKDIETGLPMGTGAARTYCLKGYECAVKFPITIDEDTHFTLLDFKGNATFDTFWRKHAPTRTTINDQAVLIEGLHGRAFMNKTQHVKDVLESKKNVPKYKADYDELNAFYANRAEVSKETKKNKSVLNEAEKVIAANKE